MNFTHVLTVSEIVLPEILQFGVFLRIFPSYHQQMVSYPLNVVDFIRLDDKTINTHFSS